MRVLIANDEPMQLRILELLFRKNNFEVMTALNGHEAFLKVQEQFDKDDLTGMIDLIVLDLNMPISDGYDACTKIVKLYN